MFTTQSRPIQPAVELQVRKLLRRPQVTGQQIAEVARRLRSWQPNVSAERQIQGFLDCATAIDQIKKTITEEGDRRVTFVANTLIIACARLYAAHMPVTDFCMLKLQEYEAATRQLADNWWHAKVSVLFRAYIRRAHSVELLREQMPTDEQAAAELAALGIEDPRQAITDLAAVLNQQRAFGVKSSMFQDGLLHADEDAWVFNDGHDMTATLPDLVDWDRPLAVTMLAKRRQVKQMEPLAERHGGFTRTYFDFQDKLMAVIRADGEFTVDIEVGAVSLSEYFAQADRRKAYDLFRLTHLLRLYNLVVPNYVASGLEVPDWPVLPQAASDRRKHRQLLQGGLRPLLLPRLRVLQHPDAIRAALETELEEAEQLTEKLSKGKKARHKVLGFVRKLPNPNGEASAEAKRLAWEQRRITLRPGQTYVKTHKRGSKPNPAIGHLAMVKSS